MIRVNILNITFKTLLFISSYIPLFILLFIQNIDIELVKMSNGDNNITKSIIAMVKNTWSKQPTLWIIIIILVILSIISLIVLFYNSNEKKEINLNKKSFTNLKSLNGNILNYFITYLIPLMTMDVNDTISIIVNSLVFIIIGIFYISEDLIHLNLIYILLGYKVYETNNKEIVISNRSSDEFKGNKYLPFNKVGKNIYVVKNIKDHSKR